MCSTLNREKDGKKREEDPCSSLSPTQSCGTHYNLAHGALGEMKAPIVLSCASNIKDREPDPNNADCKAFILIPLIGSRQVPHNQLSLSILTCVPQQSEGLMAAHDKTAVPALI